MNTKNSVTRRDFVRSTALAGSALAISAKSYAAIAGANERVRIGILGFGLIGRIHTRSFHGLAESQIVAVSDTYQPRLQAARELVGGDVTLHGDFRRMLEDKSIDAVVVATPDHWHALHTMMACAAGKDVYVEKPLTLFVKEGRWMQEVATKHQRVVQVGTQQRSAPHYQRAKELLNAGAIGEIVSVQCNFFRNVMPGIGSPPDSDPPPELDWEMLLGPAPARRYNPNRGLYHFRWFWDYSGGQMTNLGHHSLDVVHWFFGLKGPRAVSSAGGRFFLKDNGEVPDVQDAIIEYPRFPAVVQFRECGSGGVAGSMGALTFLGSKGTMLLGRDGYEIVPDKKVTPVNTFAKIIGGHPVGGPQPVSEPEGALWCEAASDKSGDWKAQYVEHAKNFLACVKSRATPNSDLASSHHVSKTCHLANLSLRLGRKLRWDDQTEAVVGDPEANAMLTRPYRTPWDRELKALGVG
jgi:predicted dehydrogenase